MPVIEGKLGRLAILGGLAVATAFATAGSASANDEPTFADVPSTSSFYTYVEWMAETGISTGTTQPSGKPLYKPSDAVSRQAMSAFLFRLSGDEFTPPIEATFADVPTTSAFFTQVEWMAATGISTGTAQPSGKPLYKPSDAVSRQAMAAFLFRMSGDIFATPSEASFADVPTTSTFFRQIEWMAAEGISTGTVQPTGKPLYKPSDPVSRQAMAAFLYRAHPLLTSLDKEFSATPTPVISGTPRVGEELIAQPGNWKPEPVDFSYQWFVNGTAIDNATGPIYTVRAVDIGLPITVKVSGSKFGYTTMEVQSTPTNAVSPGLFNPAPLPTISGTPVPGQGLTASLGDWNPIPDEVNYRWNLDDEPIAGEISNVYVVKSSDAGKTISVTVTASSIGYEDAQRTSLPVTVEATPLRVIHITEDVTEDTVWGLDVSDVFVIDRSIVVQMGATLTISAGVVVKFATNTSLDVSGTLLVTGTASKLVTLTSIRDDSAGGDTNGDGNWTLPSASDWYEIQGRGSIDVSFMDLRFSREGISGLSANRFSVSDSLIAGGIHVSSESDKLVNIANNLVARRGITVTQTTIAEGPTVPVSVMENTVTDLPATASYAVSITSDFLVPSLLSNNVGIRNAMNAFALSGTLVEDWTIPTTGLPIVVMGRIYGPGAGLDVALGSTLTIPPGAVVKFERYARLQIRGGLIVSGVEANPAVFTVIEDDGVGGDTNGDGTATMPSMARSWDHVEAMWGNSSLDISHLDVRFSAQGIQGTNAGQFKVTNSSITGGVLSTSLTSQLVEVSHNVVSGDRIAIMRRSNKSMPEVPAKVMNNTVMNVSQPGRYAYYISDDSLHPSLLAGNTGINNVANAILLAYGQFAEDWTMPATGLPFVFSGGEECQLTIPDDITVSLPAGVVVKFATSAPCGGPSFISVKGTLQIEGTEAAPVEITSERDDTAGGDTNGDGSNSSPEAGDWEGLIVLEGGTLRSNWLDVRYGRLLVNDGRGDVTLNNAFLHLAKDGCYGGSPSNTTRISGRAIDCGEYGIWANPGTGPESALVDARDVDWGDPGGPPPYGAGTPVSGPVIIYPWVGAPQPPDPAPAVDDWVPSGECTPTMYIGARGSGEVPGGPTTITLDPSYYDPMMATSTIGQEVRGLGDKLQAILNGQAVTNDHTGYFVTKEANGLIDFLDPGIVAGMKIQPLIYPAESTSKLTNVITIDSNPVGGIPVALTKFLHADINGVIDYVISIDYGVRELKSLIKEQALHCPDQEFILSGYSQGAMVVHIALAELAEEGSPVISSSRIKLVALLADPLRQGNGVGSHFGNALTGHSSLPLAGDQGMLIDAGFVLDLIQRGEWKTDIPSPLQEVTAEYCDYGDMICAPAIDKLDEGVEIHSSYGPEWMTFYAMDLAEMY